MTQRSNIDYLKIQIEKAVKKIYSDDNQNLIDFYISDITFRLDIDPLEKQHPKTNFDEIIYYHVLPQKVELDLTLDEIANILTTAYNEIPLYIKISKIDKNKSFQLLTSKRFRKRIEVEKYHNYHELAPLKIE